ncbi:MAG: hypothetical protein ACM3NS_06305 [Deltaproteobacteria bacterium]
MEVEDRGTPDAQCEMCEAQMIRHVHYMQHPDFPDVLGVGCVCAGHMQENLEGARQRERQMISRAGKRARWLTRRWRQSAKGNDWLQADGYRVTIHRVGTGWGATLTELATEDVFRSRRQHPNPDQAKLAAFDFITQRLPSRRDMAGPDAFS